MLRFLLHSFWPRITSRRTRVFALFSNILQKIISAPLDLHSCAQEQPTPAALNPFANWALNYPLFSQAAAVAAIQQNAALAAINQNQIHQHHQNQLLQQLFITQQQKVYFQYSLLQL